MATVVELAKQHAMENPDDESERVGTPNTVRHGLTYDFQCRVESRPSLTNDACDVYLLTITMSAMILRL